jgi:dipeptidyl aminopeptidase/acylaminoacyl peptidase
LKLLFVPLIAISLSGQTASFEYDHTVPYAIQVLGVEHRGDVQVEDISFRTLLGGRTLAYRVVPPGKDRMPGALFVHWYNPESMTSNRTQFLNEAVELARHGLVSLLVATPWSNPKFYNDRDVSLDYEFSVQEVKDLMRDMDVLLSYPRVDPGRVAYVGHDFGAMYGMVMTGVDQRASVAAFQAGNSRFGEWFLYNQTKLSGQEKQQVVDRLAPLDPVRFVGRLAGKPVLLQFSKKDFYVPMDRAQALVDATQEPKQVIYYDADHELNQQAVRDRIAFLREKLGLR